MDTRAARTGPPCPPRAPVDNDRAAGALLGGACGDALGAGYEFGPPLPEGAAVRMAGGGGLGWAPGEWTDDTSMAIAIAEVAATGADLRTEAARTAIARRWAQWARQAPDVGVQTRAVLSAAQRADGGPPSAQDLARAAAEHHARSGRSGGNGSLMRTAPLALAYLDDPAGLATAARDISALTHHDPEAGEACALWCEAIRHAVRHGGFDGLRLAVGELPAERARVWNDRLDEAESHPPAHFASNGWVVQALQGAWSAITRTPVPPLDAAASSFPAQHLQHALEAAVRGGNDADTVAAIAGGLLGARWGASAVPLAWRRAVHGWPGMRDRDLIALALLTARGGRIDGSGWPTAATLDYSAWGDVSALARHPHDPGVWLGGVGALSDLPAGVDAVVSLCRLGAGDLPAQVRAADHVEVWLVDQADPGVNPHLEFVLAQAADMIAALREEGRTVLVHCVQARSRTPTVGALYASRHLGVPPEAALDAVRAALPAAQPNPAFRAALRRLADPPR